MINHQKKYMEKSEAKKIKAGDFIQIADGYLDTTEGKLYLVKMVDDDGDFIIVDDSGDEQAIYAVDIISVKKGKAKAAAPNFLLQYRLQLDEDPVEEFATMKEVDDRIKELHVHSDLDRDSIVVYEIKKKYKVSISTSISKKAVTK